jgi:zinc protease
VPHVRPFFLNSCSVANTGCLGAWRSAALVSALACATLITPTVSAEPTRQAESAATPSAQRDKKADQPGDVQAVRMVEGIREYRLPNGLQVLLNPDDSKATTTVNMTYRVGSRHESYGETGMAHLLEHLLFKGSPRHPQVWSEFNKRGFSANGSTWYDRTNYFASFAANEGNLQWYLQWQADAMVNSHIARKDLDSEMTVVRNEMEMGENNPGRVLMEKTLSAMYQWHNYGKSTIGARTDVEGVDISRLKAFYKRYYQPDNATLIISGKFDVAKTLKWVQQAFAPVLRPTRVLPALYTLDPVQDGERSVTLRRVGGTPLLFAGYHVVPGAHADFAAVSLLTTVLGDSPSGRLHKQLVDKQLAAAVFSFSEGLADPGFILLGAQLGASQDADAAVAALTAAGEAFAQQPVTAEELERARAKWLKDWDAGFADPQHVGVALSESVAQGDWRLYFLLRDRVKAIALDDVQRVAQRYFVAANRTLGRYVPTAQPQRAPAPERVDVTAALRDFKAAGAQAQAEVFEATPERIDARTQRFDLPSGMKVALLPKSTRGQAVKAMLTLRYGTADSLSGWGEVPSALAALLDKGTATLNRQQVQDRLDALQADLGFSAGAGQLNVAISGRREHLPALVTLVSELLQRPSLPADVLEEVRRQALAGLDAQRKEPEAVLAEAMARHGDPYPRGDVRHARSFDEVAADWQAVQIDRVRAFHQRFVSAANAQFAVVGDFDAPAVRTALNEGFGAWRNAEPFARVPEPLVAVPAARLELGTPDKQNATMAARLALPLSDRDADYAAMMLANHLVGGGGDSRLWRRIRERDGLSYSVYSGIQWSSLDAHSEWSASAIFAPQNRDKVASAFREEIERVLKDGFTQAELESGKRGLLSFRRLGRAQDARLAAGWVNNLYLSRDHGVSARVDAQLEALTLAEVNAAWRRHIHPDRFVLGFAGDFK